MFIRLDQMTHGTPGAYIAPADIRRHNGNVSGALEQGVIDGNIRELFKTAGRQLTHRFTGMRSSLHLCPADPRGFVNFWRMFGQFIQKGPGLEAEHSGVPKEIPRFHVPLRRCAIRLLDKSPYGFARAQILPRLDVAEARFRSIRNDTEGHEQPFFRQTFRGRHGFGKRGPVLNQMVSRKHQQAGFPAKMFRHKQCRHGNGGSRVAAQWFEQKGVLATDLAEVRPDEFVLAHEVVVPIGGGENMPALRDPGRTMIGFQQQALAVGQFHERFGVAFT